MKKSPRLSVLPVLLLLLLALTGCVKGVPTDSAAREAGSPDGYNATVVSVNGPHALLAVDQWAIDELSGSTVVEYDGRVMGLSPFPSLVGGDRVFAVLRGNPGTPGDAILKASCEKGNAP